MSQYQFIGRRLADNHTIGFFSRHDGRHRTIASAFLVADGSDMYISRQLYPGILKQLYCHNRCHKTAFHISRAQAVKPAVLHGWRVRRRIPLIFISRRHGIYMAVKHQTPAVLVSFKTAYTL